MLNRNQIKALILRKLFPLRASCGLLRTGATAIAEVSHLKEENILKVSSLRMRCVAERTLAANIYLCK